jgi:curved DNA-binding protein
VTLEEVARGAERMVDVDGRRLQVKIPPGVNDGQKVKLRGGGLRGGEPGTAGDLVITVRVMPDPRFERRGADLLTELPLTLAEALLGAEVPVPTPTGTAKLRIRPNTQNGQEIHVRGRGLPKRGGGKGDLVVRTRVVLPQLDEQSREEIGTVLGGHPQPNPRHDGTVH